MSGINGQNYIENVLRAFLIYLKNAILFDWFQANSALILITFTAVTTFHTNMIYSCCILSMEKHQPIETYASWHANSSYSSHVRPFLFA